MKIKKRSLPAGWYPRTRSEITSLFQTWEREYQPENQSIGVVVPHAGWFFSGKLAFAGIQSLRREAQVICILGGHLPPGGKIKAVDVDAFETPFGPLHTDRRLLEMLKRELNIQNDMDVDNTVEVQLPMVKHLFPQATAIGLRVPPSQEAVRLGEILADIADEEGVMPVLIGSTDLTHYGPAYNFTPAGTGKKAAEWVKRENDAPVIDAMVKMDHLAMIKHANENRSACSIGAAAAVSAFCGKQGIRKGFLIDYYQSADIQPGDSFVGYAAVGYA